MTLYERFEQLSDEVETSKTTRRRALSRAAKACLGVAVAATGLARVSEARAGAGCCVLAYQTQCPNCSGRGYDCASGCTRWAWYCTDAAHHVWICGECYSGSSCSGCSCGAVVQLETNSRYVNPHRPV